MQDEAAGRSGEDFYTGSEAGSRMVEEAGEERRAEVNEERGAAAESSSAQQELAQLRGEKDQLLDRLARLQAEFDNARKREAKERTDAREYTVGNTVEPFLGVMDNFQLALKGLQVVAVETVGTQFDPRVHEALGSIETAEFPDHQVLEEIRRGYKIREKLLRPALVRIASNPAQVSA